MPFVAQLTDHVADDLEEIVDYFSGQDAPGRTEHVLERIEQAFQSLSAFPEHGSYPRELLDLGVREYRQLLFKPYRFSPFAGASLKGMARLQFRRLDRSKITTSAFVFMCRHSTRFFHG